MDDVVSKKRRIAHFGAFDHDSYGDLIFPYIAEQQLGEKFELVHVAPTALSVPWRDAKPYISVDAAVNTDDWDGVLVGGGDIIQAHGWLPRKWQDRPITRTVSLPSLWLGGCLLGARLGIPVAWNSPGVPAALPHQLFEVTRSALLAADYLSVRDEQSRAHLLPFASEAINVVPDAALLISQVWPGLSTPAMDDYSGYLAVSISHTDIEDFEAALSGIVTAVKNAQIAVKGIVFLPLMNWQFTSRELLDIRNRLARMGVEFAGYARQSLQEISEAISQSAMYVGNSLHGFIAAVSYGIPAILVTPDRSDRAHKYRGFVESSLNDPARFIAQQWSDVAARVLDAGSFSRNLAAKKAVESHWTTIRGVLSGSTTEKSHLWERLAKDWTQTTLHRARQAFFPGMSSTATPEHLNESALGGFSKSISEGFDALQASTQRCQSLGESNKHQLEALADFVKQQMPDVQAPLASGQQVERLSVTLQGLLDTVTQMAAAHDQIPDQFGAIQQHLADGQALQRGAADTLHRGLVAIARLEAAAQDGHSQELRWHDEVLAQVSTVVDRLGGMDLIPDLVRDVRQRLEAIADEQVSQDAKAAAGLERVATAFHAEHSECSAALAAKIGALESTIGSRSRLNQQEIERRLESISQQTDEALKTLTAGIQSLDDRVITGINHRDQTTRELELARLHNETLSVDVESAAERVSLLEGELRATLAFSDTVRSQAGETRVALERLLKLPKRATIGISGLGARVHVADLLRLDADTFVRITHELLRGYPAKPGQLNSIIQQVQSQRLTRNDVLRSFIEGAPADATPRIVGLDAHIRGDGVITGANPRGNSRDDMAFSDRLLDTLSASDEAFVDAAFQWALGRPSDVDGKLHYISMLRAGCAKLQILRDVRRSAESKRRFDSLPDLDDAVSQFERAGSKIPSPGRGEARQWLSRLDRALMHYEQSVAQTARSLCFDALTVLTEFVERIPQAPGSRISHTPSPSPSPSPSAPSIDGAREAAIADEPRVVVRPVSNSLPELVESDKHAPRSSFGHFPHSPLVSVLIVSYNSAGDLQHVLPSLQQQSYRHFEVILVENGTQDNSSLVATYFPDAHYLSGHGNIGFAAANNLAFDTASGELLALLNPDTRVDQDWLSELVDALYLDADAAVAVPKIRFFERFIDVELSSDGEFSVDPSSLDRQLSYTKWFVLAGAQHAQDRVAGSQGNPVSLRLPVDGSTVKLAVNCLSPQTITAKTGMGYARAVAVKIGFPGNTSIEIDLTPGPTRHARWLINNAGSSVGTDGPFDIGYCRYDSVEFDSKAYVPALCGCSALIRRAALVGRNVFAPQFFAYFEDSELSDWLRKRGFPILYTPRSIVYHRHSTSSSERSPVWHTFVARGHAMYTAATQGFTPALVDKVRDRKYGDNIPADLVKTLQQLDQSFVRQLERISTRPRPSVAIYNSYWNTMGGGEAHALSFATALQNDCDVYLVCEEDFDLERLAIYFRADLSRCRKLVLPHFSTSFTAHFDVFVNSTFLSQLESRATVSYYVVSFPQATIAERVKQSYIFLHNSSFTAKWARSYWGNHSSQVILPLLSTRPEEHEPAIAKERLVLSVGRFTPSGHSKNQHDIIAGFLQARASNHEDPWQLVLCGSYNPSREEERLYFEQLNNLIGDHKGIELLPNVDRSRLDDLYAQASIYVHATGLGRDPENEPHLHEHFGITCFESMMAGCVPLVYGVGGPAEQIGALGRGAVYRDSEEMVRELCKMMSSWTSDLARLNAELVRKAAISLWQGNHACFERIVHTIVDSRRQESIAITDASVGRAANVSTPSRAASGVTSLR